MKVLQNQTTRRKRKKQVKTNREKKSPEKYRERRNEYFTKHRNDACHVAKQKHVFDVFCNYISTKMCGLSSSVDQETIKIIEHEITNVMEENRRKF